MKLFFVILLVISHINCISQNLLANGGFEEENICTEFNQNCAPEGWIGNAFTVNYYFDTENWAASGNHFVGIIAGSNILDGRRSFIRSRLLCSMRKGNRYRLELYARSRHDVFDSIGVYFSSTDFLFEKRAFSQLQPSLVFRDTCLANYPGQQPWKKISFDYVAMGEEIFITIGSFKKQESRYSLPPEYKGYYYLFLDEISLVPADKHELPCRNSDSMKTDIYAQNERHSILERKVALLKKNVPIETKSPLTLLQRIDTLIIPDILFATASAAFRENSHRIIDSFCVAIGSRSIDSLIIDGHTDSVGTLAYNNKLSADRANSVATYISSKTPVSENLIRSYYYAYLRPVTSNQTAAGRHRNRRVEIYLYSHD